MKKKAIDDEKWQPWHQMDGEPDVYYQMFRVYATMPVGERSVRAAGKANGSKNLNGRLRQNAAKWKWTQRAAAWDAERLKEIADSAEKKMETVKNDAIEALGKCVKLVIKGAESDEELEKVKKRMAIILGPGKALDSVMGGLSKVMGGSIKLPSDGSVKRIIFDTE